MGLIELRDIEVTDHNKSSHIVTDPITINNDYDIPLIGIFRPLLLAVCRQSKPWTYNNTLRNGSLVRSNP